MQTTSSQRAEMKTSFILFCFVVSPFLQINGGQVVHITLDHEETFAIPDEGHDIVKRSAAWSNGFNDPNQNWKVKYKPKNRPMKASNEYEVVVSKDGDPTKDAESKMKKILLISASVVGGLFVLFCWYQICIKKKFICCDLKKRGRKMADTYVPGMKIKEDGQVSYYEITEEEQEALHNLVETF